MCLLSPFDSLILLYFFGVYIDFIILTGQLFNIRIDFKRKISIDHERDAKSKKINIKGD